VEVFGTPGINKPVGKCGGVACGRNVTCAVVLPSHEPLDLDAAYRRAAWADARNADLLRQYESFAPEFDKVLLPAGWVAGSAPRRRAMASKSMAVAFRLRPRTRARTSTPTHTPL
jgi:hypothetical protein